MFKYKIGERLEAARDFEVKGFDDSVKKVKTGDIGFVDSKGFIHWLSGELRSQMQPLKNVEMEGYDTNNITELIVRELAREFAIDMLLEDEDISLKHFKDAIEGVLDEIL